MAWATLVTSAATTVAPSGIFCHQTNCHISLLFAKVDSNPATITLEADHSSVLDFDSIYDNFGDDEEGDDQPRGENRIRPVTDLPTPMLSATLPSNVTLAPLLTAREAEVFVLKKRLVCFKILPPGCG